MSRSNTESPRVVKVAAGVEITDHLPPVRDRRHEALAILIGKWINHGHTIEGPASPAMPIIASDVYEWVPGGFFVVHHAFGRIGTTDVGGIEILGVDGDAYYSVFYDSFGNTHRSTVDIGGEEIRWTGDQTRCTVVMKDNGWTQVAHHEASADGETWTPSMEVTLRKVA